MKTYRREISLADGTRMIGEKCTYDGGFFVGKSDEPEWTSNREPGADGRLYWMALQPGGGWLFQRYLTEEEAAAQTTLAAAYWRSPACPWRREADE